MTPTGRLDDNFIDGFEARFGPTGKALSRLIRPAFVAPPGRTFVWGDWSSIEARANPWLANSRGAHEILDVFRESDADKTKADVYCRAASDISRLPAQAIYDGAKAKDAVMYNLRQTGKVTVLSLGFGGASGALQRMAVAYGIYLSEAQAKEIVEAWRAGNQWARRFWDELWEAVMSALQSPDTIYTAGRVAFAYDRGYLGGTLFMALPCGRLLTYPTVRWEEREEEDAEGKVVKRTHLTCRKGYGRKKLWFGTFCENSVQATAGSILRGALDRIDKEDGDEPEDFVVGHTHDEIVRECDEARAGDNEAMLKRIMVDATGWREGLPLAADIETSWYYTKAKILK
jgi:hypothetical protein